MTEERHEIIEFSPNIPLKIFMHKLGFVAKHWHKSLELLLVLEGSIEITIDGTVFHLNSEDIILINSNSIHEISSESAVMIALQINMTDINQFENTLDNVLFDCNTVTCKNPRLFDGIRFALTTLIRENSRNMKAVEYKNFALCYYLVSELLCNFRTQTTDSAKNRQKYMIRLTRIIHYIQEHYAENFTLSALAEKEGVSVPYLSNFFDKYMGINFSQYYTNIKLDHAVSDLISTNDSIESIALRNGFTESHSFVRCFKRRYGTPPSTFRKQKQEERLSYLSSDKVNYLLMEPSNYLHLLTKHPVGWKESDYNSSSEPSEKISVPPISFRTPVRKLKHTFKKFTSVSRAKDLLNADIQTMLKDLQKNVGYEYIKFHGILSDDMMVVSRLNGKLHFHYTLIDMALDFLLSINLKPLIQLSFMPRELAADPDKTVCYSPFITSPPRKISEWEALIEDFTEHLLTRYGKATVSSWLFCVWNEPVTPKSMFGFGDDIEFFRFYKHSFRAVKRVCPDIVFGSPSLLYMENLGDESWIKNFISYCRKHDCMPEFINIHYYSDILPKPTGNNFLLTYASSTFFPKRTDDFSLWIGSIRKILASLGLNRLPLYLTEWNLTLSHRNLISDTCFKSCYIMKNLLRNYDRLDSFGYWSLTDLLEENALPDTLFHGGLGIYTMNGIRKNVFYAFYFANMLGDELLASDEGYFVTRKGDSLQIITYNYVHYGNLFASGELFDITETTRYSPFDMTHILYISFDITNIENGTYELREYYVNRDCGSSYDIWIKMGAIPLDTRDTEFLKSLSTPGYHKEMRLVEKNHLSYAPVLAPLEIRFTEIKRVHS